MSGPTREPAAPPAPTEAPEAADAVGTSTADTAEPPAAGAPEATAPAGAPEGARGSGHGPGGEAAASALEGAAAGASRRTALALLGAGALAAPAVAACAQRPSGQVAGPTTSLTLRFCDAQGAAMSLDAVRSLQSNAVGERGYDDALLDTQTLELIVLGPLYQAGDGSIRVDVPVGRACTLNLSWPTSQGYSALMADLPASGTVEVLETAARGLHERQAEQAALDQAAAGKVATARQATEAALAACQAAGTPEERGKQAHRALELAATAQLDLDRALISAAPKDSVLGVTFTRPPTAQEMQGLAQRLGGAGRSAVRIVIDHPASPGVMDSWKSAIDTLRAQGVQIVGQICDSYQMADFDETSWDARVSTLLTALPDLEAWEVGNELGGSWLGPNALQRMVRAARAVRERTDATTVLTLYYQLGLDTAETSVFNMARQVNASGLAGLLDVVGLSVYPQWHPLGTAADRVLTTLATAFPQARVGVTELGYGGARLGGPWWFGDKADQTVGRSAVIDHVTSAALGRSDAWGAPFWWYFLEDEAPGDPIGPVQQSLPELVQ
ncbi:arabinogalactan endo-1,4-beta-galactosidase [Actinomyces capricornis]|uniref:Tat pathway signal sequence n=1 Tax=Actinomyces capricornis TaxID=2755559 RepID=A0ABN6K0X9_9ACTO|nr:arabinogalactan endo-1,4-beta-galactosidase [Actinomyces capricornis]BDA63250.1 hypothetical protein MANAM107_00840 [Actinomyces capricornis]